MSAVADRPPNSETTSQDEDYDDDKAVVARCEDPKEMGDKNKLANEINWQIDDIPLKYRIMAFCFVVLFSTGAAFAEATLGPLKSTIMKELNLNSTSAR
jgi:hypothetical protein